jgi:hypothetical protein
MVANAKAKLTAASFVLLALLIEPAPLLPPHRLAEAAQSMLGPAAQPMMSPPADGNR